MKRLVFVFALGVFISSLVSYTIYASDEDSDYEESSDEAVQLANKDEVINSPIKVVINLPARQLTLYEVSDFDAEEPELKMIAEFPIAVGSLSFKSDTGIFHIERQEWNPWWHPPTWRPWAAKERDTPPGPKNPLGPVKNILSGGLVRIHGTTSVKSIGTAASHGCFRMYNEDAWTLSRTILEYADPDRSPNFFDEVKAHPTRTYVVNLPIQVPVEIVYDRVEVQDNFLYVYKDLYYWKSDVREQVEDELIAAGYKMTNMDWPYLEHEIENTKEDLVFDLKELGVTRSKKFSQVQGVRNTESL